MTIRFSHKPLLGLLSFTLLACAWFLAAPAPAPAQDELKKELAKFAAQIKQFLAEEGTADFRFGFFKQLPNKNYQKYLDFYLKEELEKLGIKRKLKAEFGYTGDLEEESDDKVRVSWKLVNLKNKSVRTGEFLFPSDIFPDPEDNVVKGDKVMDKKQKYGVQVLVNSNPRTPYDKEGMAYVGFQPNDIYTVRLINNSDYEATVLLKIDGLNIFAFNKDPEPDGKVREYKIVVEQGKTVDVPGWYYKDGVSNAFQVTDDESKFLKSVGADSVITAQFAASWTDKKPDDEPIAKSVLGTTQGPPVNHPGWARVERTVGRVRATVSVFYEQK
jgi:hypothetical protein